jgi:hypothetical protein
VEAFLEWIAFDLGLLWLSALLFADEDIQNWWRRTGLAKWISKRLVVRCILEFLSVAVWLAASLYFWDWAWYKRIDLIYSFLDPSLANLP